MTKRQKIKKSILCITILVLGINIGVMADDAGLENYTLQGKGRFEYDADGSGTAGDSIDDVVYDASDLATIENQVKTGKTALSTALNQYPNTEVTTLDTFANLSTAIDTITSVPDVYYYDKATEGTSCQRYILESGAYYPCDKYGVKTSDTALSGTITIVTKDDTTTPAAGEVQLVKYTSTEDANLSAGFAGYADKTFILGSGSDNITYKNSIVYLGVLSLNQTMDCSHLENFQELTKDNFLLTPNTAYIKSSNAYADYTFSVALHSYNPSTGLLTAPLLNFNNNSQGNNWIKLTVKVFFVQ